MISPSPLESLCSAPHRVESSLQGRVLQSWPWHSRSSTTCCTGFHPYHFSLGTLNTSVAELPRAFVPNQGVSPLPVRGMFGCVWRHFLVVTVGGCFGPEMLVNALQCTKCRPWRTVLPKMSTVLRLKNQPWNFPYSPGCFLLPPPRPGHSFCPEHPACPFSCLISQCSWQLSWTPSLATHNHSKGYTHSAGRNSLIQHFYTYTARKSQAWSLLSWSF